jgi:heat shock protein HslJ
MTRRKTFARSIVVPALVGFAVLLTQQSCVSETTGVNLTGTSWQLTELNGDPATPGAGGKEPSLSFTDDGKVSGFSGCNRFTGSFQGDGGALSFSPLASTRMACAEGMEQEQRILAMLTEVERYSIRGNDLALYGDAEPQIAHLKGVPLD